MRFHLYNTFKNYGSLWIEGSIKCITSIIIIGDSFQQKQAFLHYGLQGCGIQVYNAYKLSISPTVADDYTEEAWQLRQMFVGHDWFTHSEVVP